MKDKKRKVVRSNSATLQGIGAMVPMFASNSCSIGSDIHHFEKAGFSDFRLIIDLRSEIKIYTRETKRSIENTVLNFENRYLIYHKKLLEKEVLLWKLC